MISRAYGESRAATHSPCWELQSYLQQMQCRRRLGLLLDICCRLSPTVFAPGVLASSDCSLRGLSWLVDGLQFQLGLLPGGLKDLNGIGDVLLRVIGHHLHPYTGGPLRDCRKFDQIRDQPESG